MRKIYWGILARFINLFVKVKPKHWVLGADYGNMYREGSKYMLEYMLRNHPDYHCTFITMNPEVYKMLQSKGIPCEMNKSLSGIYTIAKAECVFTTQYTIDLYFAYKKKNRRYYYLVHGQPLKIAMKALFGADEMNQYKEPLYIRMKRKIRHFFNEGYSMEDVSFVSATSDFLAPFMQKDFGDSMDVKVLGMPRNDALFDTNRMKAERWVEDTEGKFVITYMPTHRGYGFGEVSPTPFANRPDVQLWMKQNNVLLLVKNHPNMIKKHKDSRDTEVIRDITKQGLDPQVCLYHSDVLITDFSSVWMDYLLLARPVIFYVYDDFEHDDVGVHYDIRQDPPGHFCYSEEELFELIKRVKENYDAMRPSNRIISKYHKYIDGNSCERYYGEIEGLT